jgi:hypothetical protein
MPVLTGAAPPPPLQQPVYVEDVGYAVATWYAPDGTVWPLMDEARGWRTLAEGITGLDAESITITTDKRQRGGVKVRHIQRNERQITWGLEVWSDESHMQFVERWRTLMDAFAQTSELGPGWLEIARPDGSARRIACYYQDGFEGEKGLGVLSDSCVITLLAEDPYWQARLPTLITRRHATGAPFLAPFMTVSSAHVLGATTVTNPGDVAAWPLWTITGPAAGLTATLDATGEQFILTPGDTAHGNLLAGETATIRTDDPPQVRGPSREIWTPALNWPGAQLWALPKGESAVTFAVAGAGPGTQIDLSFHARYRSA